MKRSSKLPAAALTTIPLGLAAALAAVVLAGCASPTNKATTSAPGHESGQAVVQQDASSAHENTIVVNCGNKRQTRPATFILTCADANDYLTGLHWVSWQSAEAFATGTERINNCTPNCAQGTFISYPALIALWRPAPLPGHPGVLYFTRMTRIYTGRQRPPLYDCGGVRTRTCYPLTSTMDLWRQLG
jgi:hypothetical protein